MIVPGNRAWLVDQLHAVFAQPQAQLDVLPAVLLKILVESAGIQEELAADRQIACIEEIERNGFRIGNQGKTELPALLSDVLHKPGRGEVLCPARVPDHDEMGVASPLFPLRRARCVRGQKPRIGNRVVTEEDQEVAFRLSCAEVAGCSLLSV